MRGPGGGDRPGPEPRRPMTGAGSRGRGRSAVCYLLVFVAGFALGGALVWRFELGPPAGGRVEAPEPPEHAAPAGDAGPTDPPVAAVPALEEPPRPPRGLRDEVGATRDPLETLRRRRLTVPVRGVGRSELADTFRDPRGGGRSHEGIDILAPRGTPVVAVEDGVVRKLFLSEPGGITIYQYDPTEAYAYYYAHLDRYATGLEEGRRVRRGQVIGYVGTSGNAPPDTPHLHFAIYRLNADKRWWEGVALDPYRVLRE